MKKFNWGENNDWYKKTITEEIFGEISCYEKIFQIEEGDLVLDAGASIGPFGYSLKNKNIKHIYCIEPSSKQIEVMEDNLLDMPYTIIPYAIGNEDILIEELGFGDNSGKLISAKSKPFMEIINEYNIDKIDFLKTDCEGGEYNIFLIENLEWIKDNVKKISGEWHLSTPELKDKFRAFRDVYLKLLPNYRVNSICGTDIKWRLWNDDFIDYYTEVIIHIDNR